MTSRQLNVKDFKTIALKSPVSDFTGYQPTMVVLDPEYADACISVKKSNFVKDVCSYLGSRNRPTHQQ